MADTCTITGKVGAGFTMTAKVFNNVIVVNFDTVRDLLKVTQADGTVTDIDIDAASTITATVSSGAYAFTVS